MKIEAELKLHVKRFLLSVYIIKHMAEHDTNISRVFQLNIYSYFPKFFIPKKSTTCLLMCVLESNDSVKVLKKCILCWENI